MDRRGFLRHTAAGTAALFPGAALAGCVGEDVLRRRALRIAHLTDAHVEPKGRAPGGFAAALAAVETLADRPDFILNGGDAIFDAFARGREDVRAQWRVWHDGIRQGTSLPLVHCLGNHDLWGWRFHDDPDVTGDAKYGKQWALDELELTAPYYTLERAGWHCIVLDSTHRHEAGYTGRLDDAQIEWLAGALAGIPSTSPVCVVSHIPILSFAARLWFGAAPTAAQKEIIERVLLHTDGGRLKDLFRRHGNVRLCLSGHLHMQERVEYLGVSYLCSGAVSGNWWNDTSPSFQEFGPAFGLVDLYEDGGFDYAVVPIG